MIRRTTIPVTAPNTSAVIAELFVVIRSRSTEKDVYLRHVASFGGEEKFGREDFFWGEV